jgi:peptide/nickel transport system substrate-binding protein
MEERVGARLNRRRFLAGTAALASSGSLAALLAACGGGSSGGGGPTQGNAVMLLSEEQLLTRNFNPFVARPRAVTNVGMYEPSMIYNYATKKIVPWLATGYSWGDGDKTLSLKLRKGVKWSDGKPFGPDDVVFTFELMKKFPGLLGSASGVWDSYLGGVTATGNGVDFHFNYVYSPGIYDLIHQLIVPKHLWSSVDDPVKYTNPNPVATGPFTKVTAFQAQSMQVDRNPYYWQKGKPYIKALHYSSSAGNQQLTQMLITNQLDWGGGYVPNIDKIYVDKDKKHHHYWWPLTHTVSLVVNHARPPFDQLNVRKAFALAMDRPQMVKSALQGHTQVANATDLAPFMYGDWIDKSVAQSGASLMKRDVAQANQLLDSAGLAKGSDGIRRTAEGKPMKYVIQVPTGWTDWISDCEVAVGNFKDIGVQVSITTPATDSWYSNVYTGQFDICIGDTGASPTPFEYYRSLMGSYSYRPVGQSASDNWHRYKNSQADALLKEWAATADINKQKQLCVKLEKIFVDNLPTIPLYYQPDWGAYNTMRVKGFPTPSNPYAPLTNNYNASMPTQLIVLTTVQPAKSD